MVTYTAMSGFCSIFDHGSHGTYFVLPRCIIRISVSLGNEELVLVYKV